MGQELNELLQNLRLVVFDFDGVFTDNRVLVSEAGTESVWCSRADGVGLEMLRQQHIAAMVISQERNPVVSARCQKLKIECHQAVDDKAKFLLQIVESRQLPLRQVAYLGNDLNDLQCLRMVGLPVCVADAYPAVLNHCRLVTQKKGGYGAVREFCECIVAARGAFCDQNTSSLAVGH